MGKMSEIEKMNLHFELSTLIKKSSVPEYWASLFFANYYLSRKLKDASFDSFIGEVKNADISKSLSDIYNGRYNFVKDFSKLEDLSPEEIDSILLALENKINSITNYFFPKLYSDLAMRLLDLKDEDNILEISEYINSSLTDNFKGEKYSIKHSDKTFFVSYLLFDLLDLDCKNLKLESAFSTDLSKFNANKLILNMPTFMDLPKKVVESFAEKKLANSSYKNLLTHRDAALNLIFDIIENTDYQKFIMLTHSNVLFSDEFKELRKTLIKEGRIETVITLPYRFFGGTALSLNLIVFSHNNETVKLIDIEQKYRSYIYRNPAFEEKIAKDVFDALEKDSDLCIDLDFARLEEEDFSLSFTRYDGGEFPFYEFLTLNKVVKSINRGFTGSIRDLEKTFTVEETNYQYLTTQNFKDGIIDDNLQFVEDLDVGYEKFLIKDNSVIISRLAPLKVGTVDKLDKKILANGNLYFLELNENRINKDFLVAYFQSEVGIKEVERFFKGSAMKMLSIKDLERVRIPHLSMGEQEYIAKEFNKLNEEYKSLRLRMEEIERLKLQVVREELYVD